MDCQTTDITPFVDYFIMMSQLKHLQHMNN